MRNYELTERGKIAIAVIIAVILLALAVALTVKAFAKQEPQPNGNQSSAESDQSNFPPVEPSTEIPVGTPDKPPEGTPDETPPTTAESPPPSGGGFNPTDPPDETPPTNGTIPDGNDEPDGPENADPPESGPTGGNPSEGTLSFLFSPYYQDELDSETASLLEVLLKSPNNTRNSSIAVATSRLSDDASSVLMSAVKSAFRAHGIPEQRILHIENSTGLSGETIEVSFFFIPAGEK